MELMDNTYVIHYYDNGEYVTTESFTEAKSASDAAVTALEAKSVLVQTN
jgi:hypothetical protein